MPAYVIARALAYCRVTPATKLSPDVDKLFDRRHYASSRSSQWIMPGAQRRSTLASM